MSIFHKKHSTPYHVENSLRGIHYAAAHHYNEIDLDLNMSKDGVIENTHWLRPLWKDGFKDPLGKVRRMTRVNAMPHATIARLRVPKGNYRINTLLRAIDECAKVNIGARLEPKADKRFENPAVWKPIKEHADKKGVKLKGYSIRNLGGKNAGVRRVAAMNKAGIKSVVIR